jgi:hypothetical protein
VVQRLVRGPGQRDAGAVATDAGVGPRRIHSGLHWDVDLGRAEFLRMFLVIDVRQVELGEQLKPGILDGYSCFRKELFFSQHDTTRAFP